MPQGVRPGRRFAAVLIFALACTSAEERFAEHMERGRAYLDRGLTREAALEFQSALNFDPGNAAVYEQIGDVLFSRSAFAEALQYYEEAYRLDPSRLSAAMNEARLSAFANPERARELLELGLAEAPDLDIVHRTHAHLAAIEGDTGRALEAARKALALGPDDVANWAQLAAAQQARIRERQIKGRPPPDAMFEEAIATFEKVDELKGGFVRARLEKARVLAVWSKGRPRAQEAFLDALALAESQQIPVEIRFAAQALDEYGTQTGDLALRRRALQAWVKAFEDDYAAWDRLARLMAPHGETVLLELLDKRPDDPRSHLTYVSLLARKGRNDDAEAHLRRAIEDGPEHPALFERLLMLQLQDARLADARATYVRLSKTAPDLFVTRLAAARLVLAEWRTAEAARQLRGLVAERDSVEAHRLLALAEYRLGNLPEASQQTDAALRLAETPPIPVLRLKARIDVEMGRWRAALSTFRKLAEQEHRLGDAEKVLLARALYGVRRRGVALETLEQTLAAPAPIREAVLAFADLEGEADPARAQALLTAAHERAPADPELVVALTELDVRDGRKEQALQRLNRVAAAGLATPRVLLLRAQLFASDGAYEEAEADVLRAFEANPMLPGAIELLFSIYTEQERLDEALRSFEQAEEAGVLHAGARLLLARLYLSRGDTARAREMFEKVVANQPQLWSAKQELAALLVEQGGDLERALTLAREAHQASGSSPGTADTLGSVHLTAGRPQSALELFQRASQGSRAAGEDNPSFRYHLGLALLALGREAEATEAFEQALAQGEFPEAAEARRQLEAARHPEADPRSPS